MYTNIDTPHGKLSKAIIKIWIIKEVIANLCGWFILGILFYLDHLFSWKEWIGYLLSIIMIISLFFTIWSIFIEPFLLYKNWRYEANEEFLQLKFGAINEKHQIIPMTKIQSISTNQGPLLRKYDFYSISIDTMGSSHTIPALPKATAIELRNQIAYFAKIKEVES